MSATLIRSRGRRVAFYLGLCLALLAGLPPQARADTAIDSSFTRTVTADFSELGPCVRTSAWIVAYQRDGTDGTEAPAKETGGSFQILQYDACARAYLLSARGDLPDLEVDIRPSFNQATLTATVELYEAIQGRMVPVEVDLIWTATGMPFHTQETRHIQEPTDGSGPRLIINSSIQDVQRPSTATGSVRVGSLTLAQPAEFALFMAAKEGSITITP